MRAIVATGLALTALCVTPRAAVAAGAVEAAPATFERHWTYFLDAGREPRPLSVDPAFLEAEVWDLTAGDDAIVLDVRHPGRGHVFTEVTLNRDGEPLGAPELVHYVVRARSESLGGPRSVAAYPGPAPLVHVSKLVDAPAGTVFAESYVEVRRTEARTVRTGFDVRYEIVGSGRIDTPAGTYAATLVREHVRSRVRGAAEPVREALQYRWLNRALGTVALVRSAEPADRTTFHLAELVLRRANLDALGPDECRFYQDEFPDEIHDVILFGLGGPEGTRIDELTPDPVTTIGDLVALPAWNLTPDTRVGFNEVATTHEPVEASCHAAFDNRCGFGNFDNSDVDYTLSTHEFVDGAADVIGHTLVAFDDVHSYYLRAATVNEGAEPVGLSGELRICFDPLDPDFNPLPSGRNRTEVPYMDFPHFDEASGRYYMAVGDEFDGGPVTDCEPGLWQNGGCGPDDLGLNVPGNASDMTLPPPNACGAEPIEGGHDGTVSNDVLSCGPVTLPTGHVLDSVLLLNGFDFLTFLESSCIIPLVDVRQFRYFWMVPHHGIVATLTSALCTYDDSSFETLDGSDVSVGLLPPLSITATPDTDSCTIEWDPGTGASFDAFKLYWGPESGADAEYACNSDICPNVIIDGNSALITDLAESSYYATVTATASYTEDWLGTHTGDTVPYESIRFPTQVTGNGAVYPVEVPCCLQLPPVGASLRLAKPDPGTPLEIEASWEPAPIAPVCLMEYAVLSATDPSAPENFVTEECRTGDPATTSCLIACDPQPEDPVWPACTGGCKSVVFYVTVAVGSDGSYGPRQ